MVGKLQAGNTVRIKIRFYDWEGKLANPQGIVVTILDKEQHELIKKDITNNRLSEGLFFYDYTLPLNTNNITVCAEGILEGTTTLRRTVLNYSYM